MQSSRFNRDEETQAVWSIRQTSIPAYFIVSGLLFVLFNGLYVWRGLVNALPGTATADSILAALREASGMVPWIVLSTILLVEGRLCWWNSISKRGTTKVWKKAWKQVRKKDGEKNDNNGWLGLNGNRPPSARAVLLTNRRQPLSQERTDSSSFLPGG